MSKTMKVIVAAALGFAAGILLAPKSGKETRQDLKDKANDKKDLLDAKVEQVKGAVRDSVVSLKQGAGNVGVEAEELATSARASAVKLSKEATKLGVEAKVRGKRVAKEAKQTARLVKQDVKNNVK
jgi:gas vesicle protein